MLNALCGNVINIGHNSWKFAIQLVWSFTICLARDPQSVYTQSAFTKEKDRPGEVFTRITPSFAQSPHLSLKRSTLI